MSHHEMSAEEIKKLVRRYLVVFVALMGLTVLTVAIAYVHLPTPLAIGAALLIALVKGSLVAGVFMHLIDEKKAIYALLILTAFFFVVLLLWPALWHSGVVES